jgi:hypothetical protein
MDNACHHNILFPNKQNAHVTKPSIQYHQKANDLSLNPAFREKKMLTNVITQFYEVVTKK